MKNVLVLKSSILADNSQTNKLIDYSSIASGTTFAELKIFALKKCRIFTVPVELQKKFSSFIQSTSKSKMTIQKSLDELETLKKALMQQYFG